jgi:hypothetical protein
VYVSLRSCCNSRVLNAARRSIAPSSTMRRRLRELRRRASPNSLLRCSTRSWNSLICPSARPRR